MNRIDKINFIRKKLRSSKHSIGTWIQIPHSSIAEILGKSGPKTVMSGPKTVFWGHFLAIPSR